MDGELIDVYDAERVWTGLTVPRSEAHLKPEQYMMYVYALIEDAHKRFLITQRALNKHWAAGCWEVTGGGVAAGETSPQAMVREISEEVGLDVSEAPLVPVYSYRNDDSRSGDNYFADIYHFHLNFSANDISLQTSEAIDFKLATWDEIVSLNSEGKFLHFNRLRRALIAEGSA